MTNPSKIRQPQVEMAEAAKVVPLTVTTANTSVIHMQQQQSVLSPREQAIKNRQQMSQQPQI